MAVMFLVDLVDTLIKGSAYYGRLAMLYNVRALVYLVLCLIAAKRRQPAFHPFFAIFAIISAAVFITVNYRTLF